MPHLTDIDHNSRIDRVRLRVTRLIRLNREGAPHDARSPEECTTLAFAPAAGVSGTINAARLARLAEDLRTLQASIEDSEQLIRQAWNVAGDLNQVRRGCDRCSADSRLPAAIGFYQGLLNHWRFNMRAAAKAVESIKAVLSRTEELSGVAAPAESDDPDNDAARRACARVAT